ncbi:hypothetical protein HPB51_010492 [Rhipicephalus microplus]|uniref:Uncharacterized protein n=1 Tax=Rhipicephalus microplus TaxID=6941 RepID=A0A9J6E0L5_RHIMP|nr:hypothetical protein HPB51_010492 [Rhipicephalus microplus]
MPWTTPSVQRQTPQAPTGGAASVAPPSLNTAPPKVPVNPGRSLGTTQTKEVPTTSSPVGLKAPFVTTKPTTKTTLSVVSSEAMDTSAAPVQIAPKERREFSSTGNPPVPTKRHHARGDGGHGEVMCQEDANAPGWQTALGKNKRSPHNKRQLLLKVEERQAIARPPRMASFGVLQPHRGFPDCRGAIFES